MDEEHEAFRALLADAGAEVVVAATPHSLDPDAIYVYDPALVTDDGAVILLRYDTGLIRGDQAFLDALQNGEETGPGDQYMFMVPEFEVGSDRYDWLTLSLFLAQGRLAGAKLIEYAVHRVQ